MLHPPKMYGCAGLHDVSRRTVLTILVVAVLIEALHVVAMAAVLHLRDSSTHSCVGQATGSISKCMDLALYCIGCCWSPYNWLMHVLNGAGVDGTCLCECKGPALLCQQHLLLSLVLFTC